LDKNVFLLWRKSLERKKKHTEYTSQFKLDVINYRKETDASTTEVAKKFGLNNPALITSWERKLRVDGINGIFKPQGRSSMTKNDSKELTELEKVKEENERLRLENSHLKKLKSYLENPEELSDRLNSRSLKNSKKKESH